MSNQTNKLSLRKTEQSDLETFFINQLDDEAGYMAAFTAKDPTDKEAYMAKWNAILADETKHTYTIFLGHDIAGSIGSYQMDDAPHITYWIGKAYWGKGIATWGLQEFLTIMTTRPLYGSAAADNIASRRVMEHCGFKITGSERGFANARNAEIEEVCYKLD